jgi:chorismate mutase/prephenate dehydratase
MIKNNEDIDRQIIGLLSERVKTQIEALKKAGDRNLFFGSVRESLFEAIDRFDHEGLPISLVRKIYTDLFSFAVHSVEPLKISYLGPAGTFSNLAAIDIFGESVEYVPMKTMSDIFREVEQDKVNYGVVPIENSIEGGVTFTLDEFMESDLTIISEKFVRISIYLLSKSTDISQVKKIYTHPQPLGQCKAWLRNNLPGANILTVDSTSQAAELAAKDPESASIGSRMAADIYQLNVLANQIEDTRQNITRFFVIGKHENERTGHDKTSIVCAVKDKPGALLDLLTPLSQFGINMTKIESRPDKKKMWTYNFFIDFQGHKSDEAIVHALGLMREATLYLKILGSYPIGS